MTNAADELARGVNKPTGFLRAGIAERLLRVVQELSLASSAGDGIAAIVTIVKHAARELTGADGASFVMRDGDFCSYIDEDAIAPLWKGQKFPIEACVSGWAMLNKQAVAIEDIYLDPRVPHDAYRPTFVRSLVMVPIRALSPIGAIGNYWSETHRATDEEMLILQALADSTSIALDNAQLYANLEQRVALRTSQLEEANRELDAFSHSVAHELRTPIGHMLGFSSLIADRYELPPEAKEFLGYIQSGAKQLNQLVDDLLRSSRAGRQSIERSPVDLTAQARACISALQTRHPERRVDVHIADGLSVDGDTQLLRVVLENLLGNAWKYSSKKPHATIRFERATHEGHACFVVRDNGAGFDASKAERLFVPFTRLHAQSEFPGTGIGLSTVRRILVKHGGQIWAESKPGEGAAFYFMVE